MARAHRMWYVTWALRQTWPARRMQLWHPESPGSRVHVRVLWPRYLWVKDVCPNGHPQGFATLSEVREMYANEEYL